MVRNPHEGTSEIYAAFRFYGVEVVAGSLPNRVQHPILLQRQYAEMARKFEELSVALLQGEALSERDFTAIYTELAPYAIGKTVKIIGDEERAKDIVHDCFLRLFNGDADFPHKKAIYRWVYQSCHNAAIDHLRSGFVRTSVAVDDAPEPVAHDEPFAAVAYAQVLQKLFASLSERDAQVFCYHYLEGLKIREISELIDASMRTISRSLTESKKRLAEIAPDYSPQFGEERFAHETH